MRRAILLITVFALFSGCGSPPRDNPLDPANPNGGTIKGYIQSTQFEPVPVPSLVKGVYSIDMDEITVFTEPPSVEATPDSTGAFTIDSVPPGWVKIIGIYEGDSMFAETSDTVETLVYAGGITDSIKLTLDQLRRMGRIEGVALHIFSGEIIGGLKIKADALHSAYSCTTRTDINGFFSLSVPVYTPVKIVALPLSQFVTLYPRDSIILFDDGIWDMDSLVVGEIDTVWDFNTDIIGDVPPGWIADNTYWAVNEIGGERAFIYTGATSERDIDIALYDDRVLPQQYIVNMNVRKAGAIGDDWVFGAIISYTEALDEMRAIVVMISRDNVAMMSTYPDSSLASTSPGTDFVGTLDVTIANYEMGTILYMNGEPKLNLAHPPFPEGKFGLVGLAYGGQIIYDNITVIK